MTFIEKLQAAWRDNDSLVCVGLDPDPARFPAHLAQHADAFFEFGREIVDATADLVCAFKPQFAHYAAAGATGALFKTIAHIRAHHPRIPVILDAKRGDIGSTAEMYAREAFDHYHADALTVSPYLGGDTLKPFTDRKDRGVIVLCRTSNPGAGDLQDLLVSGTPVYEVVAGLAAREWNANGNVLLVVGATYPKELGAIRSIVGDMPILVPGVGAQGGDVAAVIRAGLDSSGAGLIVSSSREIIYAGSGPDFAAKSRAAAAALRETINRHRH
jgi:orotidine-5'-phosphate decarboxylase